MKLYRRFLLIFAFVSFTPVFCIADSLTADSPTFGNERIEKAEIDSTQKVPEPPQLSDIHFRNKLKNRWLFFVVCAIMFLYGLNRVINIRRHDQLLTGSLRGMVLKSNEAVYSELSVQTMIGAFVSACAAGLVLFYWLPFKTPDIFLNGLHYYGFLVTIVLFLSAIKAFLYYFLGSVLEWKELSDILLIQNIVINYVCFLLICPWVLIDHYFDHPFVNQVFPDMALILFVGFALLRIYRTVRAMTAFWPFAYFYLFLYLCALEILPWLVTMRLFRVFE